jgi:hypothetical protein
LSWVGWIRFLTVRQFREESLPVVGKPLALERSQEVCILGRDAIDSAVEGVLCTVVADAKLPPDLDPRKPTDKQLYDLPLMLVRRDFRLARHPISPAHHFPNSSLFELLRRPNRFSLD